MRSAPLSPTDTAYRDVQVVPETASDNVQHILATTCWCQPDVETDAASSGRVVIHRRLPADAYHYERDGICASDGEAWPCLTAEEYGL